MLDVTATARSRPGMAVPGGEKVPLTPGPLFPRPSGDHPGRPLPLSRYEMAVREAHCSTTRTTRTTVPRPAF
jgi:hypothetical protein